MGTAATTHVHTGRTAAQWAALIFGIVFIAVALLGFVSGGMTMESDPARAPHLIGMFPVNLLHNVVHLAFGIAGLVFARTFSGARGYLIVSGVIYLLLSIYGLIIDHDTAANFVPIDSADNWLHLVLAAGMLVLGFVLGRRPANA